MVQSYNESILKSTIRVFFKVFAVMVGILVAFALGMIALSSTGESIKKPEKGELIVAADAEGNRKILDESAPVILKLNIKGVIGEGNLRTEKIENLLLDIEEGCIKKGRIKGLLLAINTPGGLATDSAGIFHAIKVFKAKHKIPVYASVAGPCASGGMYIAAIADQIFATNDSLVGSIGARMGPFFNFADGMEKIGIKSITITDGKDKDMMNPFRPWKEGEDASLQDLIKEDYKRFVDHMTTARPRLDKEKLINVYGAQVFDGPKGKEYGYVDIAGASYSQTIGALAKAAKIQPDTKYQVIEIKVREGFLKELLENRSHLLQGKIVHSFETGSYFKPEMSGKLLYLYTGPAY